ncbi:MAG: SDR family oxidoreductase, partial [Alphaproteobacteria bacterium]
RGCSFRIIVKRYHNGTYGCGHCPPIRAIQNIMITPQYPDLQDKVALVTGGSRGLGLSIANILAQNGCKLVLAASSQERLQNAANHIHQQTGHNPTIHAANLKSINACQELHQKITNTHNQCNILINAAGDTQNGNFLQQNDNLWIDGFNLKFYATVRLSRLLWTTLAQNNGTIINIIGGYARNPSPDFLIGAAVNGALANFSKGLAKLGMKDGVNVNVIHPGPTQTQRLTDLYSEQAIQEGKSVQELINQTIQKTGVQRLGQPQDVAELAAFLCSDKARHIQGVAIAVDGGANPSTS